MTYSIQTKDGIVISGIPDSVSRDSPLLRERVAQERARLAAQAAGAEEMTPAAAPYEGFSPAEAEYAGPAEEMTMAEAPPAAPAAEAPLTAAGAARGLLYGAGPVAAGAAMGAAMGAPFAGVGAAPGAALGAGAVVAGDITTSLVNSVFGTNYSSPTEAMRHMLTRLGVEKPETEAERIVQTVTEAGAGALGGAGMARTAARALAPTLGAAPGVGARIATALAEKPAEQAMMAMGGALAGQRAAAASREAGIEQTPEAIERARLVGEVAGALGTGALMRRVPGMGAVVTPAAVSAERAAQQRAIAAGQAAEIPVMTTDIIPPRTFSAKMARGLGEKIPFTGTGATRRAQQEARVAAVDNFLREQGAIDDESFTLMSDIAADLQKTRGVKLSSLLEKKRSVIEQSGASDIPVDVSGAQKAIQSKLKQLEILTGPEYRETERMLSEFSEKLSNKTPFQIEKQKQALGMTLERSDLENIRTEAKKVLSGVYSSLNKDIENHIAKNAGPEALAKYQSAQKVLAPMAQDLKDFAELSMALNQGDKRMGAVINMMNNTDPKVAKKLYDNLSAQGQATMRAAVVTDVANKAGGLENLSPEKFLTQVKAKAKQLSVVMDKEDMTRLRNLQRALKVTVNASQAALAPPTGVQSVPFLAGGGLVAALGTSGAAATGFGAGALARAFESAPVRDLLMKMPTVKPGSRAETELAREIAVAMELAMRENEPVSTGR